LTKFVRSRTMVGAKIFHRTTTRVGAENFAELLLDCRDYCFVRLHTRLHTEQMGVSVHFRTRARRRRNPFEIKDLQRSVSRHTSRPRREFPRSDFPKFGQSSFQLRHPKAQLFRLPRRVPRKDFLPLDLYKTFCVPRFSECITIIARSVKMSSIFLQIHQKYFQYWNSCALESFAL